MRMSDNHVLLKEGLSELAIFKNDDQIFKLVNSEGHSDGKGNFRTKETYQFFTTINRYTINVVDKNDSSYLGCTMSERMPRAGEDWTRGSDLPDGDCSRETWEKIKNAIIAVELVELAPEHKAMCDGLIEVDEIGPSLGEVEDNNDTTGEDSE